MKKVIILTFIIVMLVGLTGCGKISGTQNGGNSSGSASNSTQAAQATTEVVYDQMNISSEEGCQFYVMNLKGETVEVYNEAEVHTRPLMMDQGVSLPEVEDGHFKKITADVDIYDGGEGGYMGDKFIKRIIKVEDADYRDVIEALEMVDASGNTFHAREFLKFQEMNDNYILAANGHNIEVYKDGEFFMEFLLDDIKDDDYPKPFFEAIEEAREEAEAGSPSDAESGAEDSTYDYVEVDGYKQITAATAQKIMENETDYIILDVRSDEEYYEGHIPDAINYANEAIEDEMIPDLPDKDQMILVYCRSGRRSKDAAKKLAAIGYTNVYEFGGIIYWPGPITEY